LAARSAETQVVRIGWVSKIAQYSRSILWILQIPDACYVIDTRDFNSMSNFNLRCWSIVSLMDGIWFNEWLISVKGDAGSDRV
jgi:hypothetical protein